MPMMRTHFSDQFFFRLPYMRMVSFEEYGEPDDMFRAVFNVHGSDRMREQDTGVTGFGLAALIPEGEAVVYDIMLEEYDKSYTHSKYGTGFQISEETLEDDLDGKMRQGSKALGRAMRTTKNITVWQVWNLAFAAGAGQTGETTPDGVSVFNNAHPLKEGGTFDNLIEADLSILALESAINIFHDMRDQRNNPIEIEPGQLLHPPELLWLVSEILGSPDKPDTANRSINPLHGYLSPVMSKWLTDPDTWFVGAKPNDYVGPHLFNRRELRVESDMDFDTGNGKTKATHRHSQGWSTWIGWVGGQGQ